MAEREISEIAGKLTEAQRLQIMRGLIGDDDTRALAKAGLCWFLAKAYDFEEERMEEGGWKLRALGLAVREHLLAGEA